MYASERLKVLERIEALPDMIDVLEEKPDHNRRCSLQLISRMAFGEPILQENEGDINHSPFPLSFIYTPMYMCAVSVHKLEFMTQSLMNQEIAQKYENK